MHTDGARVARGALEHTLAELVRIDSVNPAFGGAGEGPIAEHVRARMEALGMETAWHEPLPGRPSVVGRLRGGGGGPALMLYAHLDTVGVEGMDAPFSPRVEGGRMYGRGTVDMKGGLAACLAAVGAVGPLAGDLLLACVADEEEASLGMEEVLRHHTADAAIVAEPTALEMVVAHNGFCWLEVETRGRAAHGSLHAEGIDANLRMGRVLARLDALRAELLARPPHPLTGPPSLHAATLHGGSGWSTYADRCTLRLERRTVPGETPEQAAAEVQALLDALAAQDPTFHASLHTVLARPAWEAAPTPPSAAAVAAASPRASSAPPPARPAPATGWTPPCSAPPASTPSSSAPTAAARTPPRSGPTSVRCIGWRRCWWGRWRGTAGGEGGRKVRECESAKAGRRGCSGAAPAPRPHPGSQDSPTLPQTAGGGLRRGEIVLRVRRGAAPEEAPIPRPLPP
jgi:acetylornithine deacetylase